MNSVQERLAAVGVHVPEVLLPSPEVDLEKWAVIACDQHTSEPEYWERADAEVGDAPSTLRLIYPEVYLGEPDSDARIRRIRESMDDYIDRGVLRPAGETMVLTRRTAPGSKPRSGLLLALDLEAYDYRPGSTSLIRATEETIVERLPPRIRIRKGASIELPHILVLIDDPEDALFSGLIDADPPQLYDTSLMLGGGRVTGARVEGALLDHVATTLEKLARASESRDPFLFAMGDGNHSLATAKAVWEESKAAGDPDPRARYALVEVTNIYDPGLTFEPIHRLVTGPGTEALRRSLGDRLAGERTSCDRNRLEEMLAAGSRVGLVTRDETGTIEFSDSDALPVAEVQDLLNDTPEIEVDYIHGWEATVRLGQREGSMALLMPPFRRDALYPYIEHHGVLPRKAFSLGEAREKRYYLEARRIS